MNASLRLRLPRHLRVLLGGAPSRVIAQASSSPLDRASHFRRARERQSPLASSTTLGPQVKATPSNLGCMCLWVLRLRLDWLIRPGAPTHRTCCFGPRTRWFGPRRRAEGILGGMTLAQRRAGRGKPGEQPRRIRRFSEKVIKGMTVRRGRAAQPFHKCPAERFHSYTTHDTRCLLILTLIGPSVPKIRRLNGKGDRLGMT